MVNKYNRISTVDLESSLLVKIFTLSIIISPFLKQYASPLPGASFADILLICLALLLMMKRGFHISIKKPKFLFFLWFVGTILTLLSIAIQNDFNIFNVSVRYIRFTFYIFLVLIAVNHFNAKLSRKALIVLSTITAIYVIIQTITYKAAGIVLPFKVLPFPWANGSTFDEAIVLDIAQKYFYRPSGFFIEPATASQYMLPGLVFALFPSVQDDKILKGQAFLIIIGLFLTTSSIGIVIGVIVLGIFVLKFLREKIRSKLAFNILVVMFLMIFIFVLFQVNLFEMTLSKITGDVRGGSSTAFRIYRGIAVFKELPIVYQLIGVGHGNLGHYVLTNGVVTKFDPIYITESAAEYANGFSLVLLYYGLIGSFVMIIALFDIIRKTSASYKVLAIVYICLLMISGAFFNISVVFYFSLLYSGYKVAVERCDNDVSKY